MTLAAVYFAFRNFHSVYRVYSDTEQRTQSIQSLTPPSIQEMAFDYKMVFNTKTRKIHKSKNDLADDLFSKDEATVFGYNFMRAV